MGCRTGPHPGGGRVPASGHSTRAPTHLAELLAAHFTVLHYDRRGRGESTDTQPYAVEREIEDLGMLSLARLVARHWCSACRRAAILPSTPRRLPIASRLLDGRRSLEDVGKGHEPPGERGCRRVPHCAHGRQVFIRAGTPVVERRAQCSQLRFDIADADADNQPPLPQDVDRRQPFGQQHGPALGQDDHANRQPHPSGRRPPYTSGRPELRAVAGRLGPQTGQPRRVGHCGRQPTATRSRSPRPVELPAPTCRDRRCCRGAVRTARTSNFCYVLQRSGMVCELLC
jgi:hypothetical protein